MKSLFRLDTTSALRRSYSKAESQLTTLLKSRINAPSTLPPPLVLPTSRDPSDYYIQYAYKLGKGYLQFYKSGFKQILANRTLAKQIRAQRINDPLIATLPGSIIDHKTGQVVAEPREPHSKLSRAEFQLLRRHAKDIKKVPVFAVLLAIFGEWLPLFVIFLDPLIPGTVLLPVQILRRRRKASATLAGGSRMTTHQVKGDLEGAGIHDRDGLVLVAKRFGLLGPISRYFPGTTILKRIRLHEEYLCTDDALILQNADMPLRMIVMLKTDEQAAAHDPSCFNSDELALALEERGLWKEKQDTSEQLSLLNEWLDTSRSNNS